MAIPVTYTIRHSRSSKNLKLTVRSDGKIYVSAPPRVPLRYIDAFVAQHEPWILRAQEQYRAQPRSVPWSGSRDEFAAHRKEAMRIVTARLQHFNTFYGFVWNKVTIRNQTTRWGSCSRRGHLSVNYRIVFLAPELADYLIVHELCHLGQFNHSKKFWALVARALPDYRVHRVALQNMQLA